MWNCDWEYENQETLKQWYEEKISGAEPNLAVRRIICKGCGRVFYTQIVELPFPRSVRGRRPHLSLRSRDNSQPRQRGCSKGLGRCPNKQKLRFPATPGTAVSSLCGNKDTACPVCTEFGTNLVIPSFQVPNLCTIRTSSDNSV